MTRPNKSLQVSRDCASLIKFFILSGCRDSRGHLNSDVMRLDVATTQKLPANIYGTICPACGATVEFPLFQASFYDFATYQETHSGQIFRFDLDACHYLRLTVDDLLAEAKRVIGDEFPVTRWIQLPNDVRCDRCGEIFPYGELRGVAPIREQHIDAYAIPAA
jgi:hypothetical protein